MWIWVLKKSTGKNPNLRGIEKIVCSRRTYINITDNEWLTGSSKYEMMS